MAIGIEHSVDVVSHCDEIKDLLETACETALEAVGLVAEGNAKVEITDMKAVDTGRLRASITHATDGKDVYIGTNVEYAKYVELGTGSYYPGGRKTPWRFQDEKGNWHQTGGMAPRPFLKNAVTKPAYQKMYENTLKQYLSE